MPASAIPALKAALHDALTVSPAFAGVDVLWDMGLDVGDEEHTVVGFLEATSTQVFAGVRGPDRQARDEQLVLRLGVRHVVFVPDGGSPRGEEDVVWALASAVDDVARHDQAVRAVAERVPRVATVQQSSTKRSDGTWDIRCELTVAVNARIRPPEAP